MEYFLIGAGIFTILCTYFKPAFYWESRKAKRMRNAIGEKWTAIIYYVIGIFLIIVGILDIIV